MERYSRLDPKSFEEGIRGETQEGWPLISRSALTRSMRPKEGASLRGGQIDRRP